MNRSISLNRGLLSVGITLALLCILIFLMRFDLAAGNSILGLAITIDLILIVPLIYFFLIRKTSIPKTTVIPIMVAGLFIGTHLLPKDNQEYLQMFKIWALPLVELSILTFIVIKVRGAIKKYKSKKRLTADFFTILKSTCYEIMPRRLVMPFVTEIAVFYYGFLNWKTIKVRENEFTYHKKSGTPALLFAFVFLIGIETFAFHLLLVRWNMVIAWIFTGLSLYTAVQVYGFAKSLSKRPLLINENTLTLRYGILNEVEIQLSDIEKTELSKKRIKQDSINRKLSPLGDLESHNVIIQLKKENTLTGIYGLQKRFKVLGLHVDNAVDFVEKINNAIQHI